jgi:hypothetical protein
MTRKNTNESKETTNSASSWIPYPIIGIVFLLCFIYLFCLDQFANFRSYSGVVVNKQVYNDWQAVQIETDDWKETIAVNGPFYFTVRKGDKVRGYIYGSWSGRRYTVEIND